MANDAEPSGNRARSDDLGFRWWLWVLISATLAGFVALARLTTYQTMTERGRGYVWEQWWRLRRDLPDVGQPGVMVAAYLLMLALVAGGSLLALWLALLADGTDDPVPAAMPSDGAAAPPPEATDPS
jgi:hypothetical protein